MSISGLIDFVKYLLGAICASARSVVALRSCSIVTAADSADRGDDQRQLNMQHRPIGTLLVTTAPASEPKSQ